MNLITKMLPHQVEAVEKLSRLKVGALFMEQGTGKTRTALEIIKLRMEQGKIDKVLWFCPCSVKNNLAEDIIKHAGEVPDCFMIVGIQSMSSSVRVNEECLKFVSPKCQLIVDESLMVKNHKALRSQNIVRLSEICQYKMILNGTPISKSYADLYNQFFILDWRILGYRSFYKFARNHLEYDDYGNIRGSLNTRYLTQKIAPYSFEVKKSDCMSIPHKNYRSFDYDLTHLQSMEYNRVADELLFKVDEFDSSTIYRLFFGLQAVISGLKIDYIGDTSGMITSPLFENFENPRLEALDRAIETINEDEKIIIFCKFSHEIDTLCKYLPDSVRFDGSINIKNREKNLEQFKLEKRFLIANKVCAGFGLNLQFCKNMIFYSNDWDFATRSQAEDRIHRIGQVDNPKIIDVYAAHTLDERIMKCLSRKENLLESFKKSLNDKKQKNFIRGCD